MLSKKSFYIILLASILILPISTSAQVTDVQSLGVALLRPVWIVFAVIAIICFVVAGVLFLTAQGDPVKIAKARSAVLWGLAGVVVGIFAYSALNIVGSLLQ